jgi:hypothetical protein
MNEDTIFRNMFNTMRDMRVAHNKRLVEEYEGNYNQTETEVVTEEKYPGIKNQIIDPLLQKIPNVKLEDNSLNVNKIKSTITLNGIIPSLSGLKFAITTDISNTEPLHVSVEDLNLSGEGLNSLTALYAFAKTLYNEWSVNKVKETFK